MEEQSQCADSPQIEVPKPLADALFEVSFEVANKVGGIHTVISTKAKRMMEYYGDNYYAVGYYNPEKAPLEFDTLPDGPFEKVFATVYQNHGIKCYYGKWIGAPGGPRAILVDTKDFQEKKADIKARLWEAFGIDSLGAGDDFDTPIVWSYAVGILLSEIEKQGLYKNMVAHFHEWLSGGALLYLKMVGSRIKTVFTTHATMLGRSMAGNGIELIERIDRALESGETATDEEAKRLGCLAKHHVEKACARNAHVFTTVSEPTAREAQYILGVRPHLILPNGMNTVDYPAMEMLSYKHQKNKKKLLRILKAYFAPYFEPRITPQTRIIFMCGRHEYHNKGIDLALDALGRLNRELKNRGVDHDTFFLLAIPTSIRGEKIEVLQNIALYNELEDHIQDIEEELRDVFIDAMLKEKLDESKIMEYIREQYDSRFRRIARTILASRGKPAPICAMELAYPEENDPIINGARYYGLLNREEDPIKILYYPTYISEAERTLPMDYTSVVQASSIAVFPSYYEPWGYTPLEAAANGTVAITTDLAGFGKYLLDNFEPERLKGIIVLKRRGRSWDAVAEDLKNILLDLLSMSQAEITKLKENAKELSSHFSWKILAPKYVEAHNRAIQS